MTDSLPSRRLTAIVTGASRGIGRAIAVALCPNHEVIVNYYSNSEAALKTVGLIESAGGCARAVQADVANSAGRQALIDAATENDRKLNVLVNNAGITSPGRVDLLETTEQSWDAVLGTNLKGPFFLAQAAANVMIAQNNLADTRADSPGTIVNISSISAYAVSLNRPEYCIAKSAIGMMTHLFATRLANENVMVYEVSPGAYAVTFARWHYSRRM